MGFRETLWNFRDVYASSPKNTFWIAGWMWGKYPEQAQTYPLPLATR